MKIGLYAPQSGTYLVSYYSNRVNTKSANRHEFGVTNFLFGTLGRVSLEYIDHDFMAPQVLTAAA